MSEEIIIYKSDSGVNNKPALERFFMGLANGRYKLVATRSSKRSLPQNAWFHAILDDIRKGLVDAGYNEVKTNEDAKDVVKALFFKKTVSNGVENIEVVEGTSKQSKINFAEKAEDIIKWAKEYLGVDIAPPETQIEVWESSK